MEAFIHCLILFMKIKRMKRRYKTILNLKTKNNFGKYRHKINQRRMKNKNCCLKKNVSFYFISLVCYLRLTEFVSVLDHQYWL